MMRGSDLHPKQQSKTSKMNELKERESAWMNECASAVKTLFVMVFLSVAMSGNAQKVFSVDYASQADVKVFVVDYMSQADLCVYRVNYASQATGNSGAWFWVDYESQADKKIFFVDYESQADLKIYFVEYSSQSEWKNRSKMHLMY